MSSQVEDKYYDIFFIQCEHMAQLHLESAEWCSGCNAWIEGNLVGDLTLRLKPDGTVEVFGGGYVSDE